VRFPTTLMWLWASKLTCNSHRGVIVFNCGAHLQEARRHAAHTTLVTLMRSWTGLLWLGSDPFALRSLIGFLALPPSVKGSGWAKEAIFELFSHLLSVLKMPDAGYAPALLASLDDEGERAKGINSTSENNSTSGRLGSEARVAVQPQPNLLCNYAAMLLLALINGGIVEVLTMLSLAVDSDCAPRARRLLNDLFLAAADLLPNSHTVKLNMFAQALVTAMPDALSVTSSSSSHHTNPARMVAVSFLADLATHMTRLKLTHHSLDPFHLHLLTMLQYHQHQQMGRPLSRNGSSSTLSSMAAGQPTPAALAAMMTGAVSPSAAARAGGAGAVRRASLFQMGTVASALAAGPAGMR
jgi:hypothetical protein